MKANFHNINIRAISAAVPQKKLFLTSLSEEFGELEVKRIIENTGIHSVSTAKSNQTTSDLCFAAAKSLFEQLDIDCKSIDAIILITQTPDVRLPATSVILQDRLGLSRTVLAFDINYGCSGYIYGLLQGVLLIQSGVCQRILVCTGDVITNFIRQEDHHIRMVFGDAGSATLIERGQNDIAFCIYTDGSGAQYLNAGLNKACYSEKDYLQMNGKAIMEFALREIPLAIQEILEFKKWSKDEVGSFILHQANYFMLNYLRKIMKIEQKALPISVKNVGNTGSASIPVTLCIEHESLIKQNRLDKVVLCGFGVGLSWGAATSRFTETRLLPLIEI